MLTNSTYNFDNCNVNFNVSTNQLQSNLPSVIPPRKLERIIYSSDSDKLCEHFFKLFPGLQNIKKKIPFKNINFKLTCCRCLVVFLLSCLIHKKQYF